MKDPKNDSTPVLERFGRDKRKRTVVATAERVERRPRLQRDAADSEQPSFENRPELRITPISRPTTVRSSRSRTTATNPAGRATARAVRMTTARVPMATVSVSTTISRVRMATVSVRTTTVRGVPSETNPATTVTVTAATRSVRAAVTATSPTARRSSARKNSGIRNSATGSSSTNRSNLPIRNTTTNRRHIRNSIPRSRRARCA